ncbi:GerAB/ArcD/ProY family transporter [Paenibacillus ehimensis]|uniref:GerAB/ArcD/ProY family transporter n=1 Tax=Paenibacillus ehimensis TaxID=79264 RepID=UPI000FD973A6|nr:GerAB/ArcD/ProY family transporter [Paenibacillus ehimensis]
MPRFIYNLVLLFMLMNTMMYVPAVLLQDRYDGAMTSVLAGAALGSAMLFLFLRLYRSYPGQGLPEIMAVRLPKWVVAPLIAALGLLWAYSGIQAVVGFTVLISRFITPDIRPFQLLVFTSFIVWIGATRSSKTVLLATEILLILNVPIMAVIFFKAVGGDYMNWDAVRAVANHYWNVPTFRGIAAASFVWSGIAPMAIMNRFSKPSDSVKYSYILPAAGLFLLLASLFIPVGYHGTEGVTKYIYIWITTSDALAMEFGFIERVVFIFATAYLNLSLLYGIVTWHMGAELIKSCFSGRPPNLDEVRTPAFTNILCGLFVVCSFAYLSLSHENYYFKEAERWLMVRLAFELLLCAGAVFLLRRKAGA